MNGYLDDIPVVDVPGDIPHPFWIEWRKLVKGINPDAYISGEVWTWSQPWLSWCSAEIILNDCSAERKERAGIWVRGQAALIATSRGLKFVFSKPGSL